MEIRTPYGKRHRVKQPVGEKSRTQQHDAKYTDINYILKRYEKDQILEHVNQHQGEYGDFSMTPDFQESMNKLNDAQNMFMTLPASVRKKFENDPGQFLAYATDEKNKEGMQELGLLPKPSKTPPDTLGGVLKEALGLNQKEDEPKATKAKGSPPDGGKAAK